MTNPSFESQNIYCLTSKILFGVNFFLIWHDKNFYSTYLLNLTIFKQNQKFTTNFHEKISNQQSF